MGKGSGDGAQKMCGWERGRGKERETLTCDLFAQHLVSGRSNVSLAEGRREEIVWRRKVGIERRGQLFVPQF